jgi:hypothetical protein
MAEGYFKDSFLILKESRDVFVCACMCPSEHLDAYLH